MNLKLKDKVLRLATGVVMLSLLTTFTIIIGCVLKSDKAKKEAHAMLKNTTVYQEEFSKEYQKAKEKLTQAENIFKEKAGEYSNSKISEEEFILAQKNYDDAKKNYEEERYILTSKDYYDNFIKDHFSEEDPIYKKQKQSEDLNTASIVSMGIAGVTLLGGVAIAGIYDNCENKRKEENAEEQC